ncbi:MAG: ACP S-malonyltransferase [Actinobacteria bacterium]|nr:ACP S-malonyltransferase [Actinomycetota bacterium]
MTLMSSTTALLFPGQGSHSQGMEAPYRDHPLLQRGIELLGFDPFSSLDAGTRSHQPALFLCSMAQWTSDRREDDEPPLAAAGHSLGEYAALTAAGAIEFDEAVRLVDARSDAMAKAADMQSGGMVAILGGDRDDVLELGAALGLSLANDNAPGQIVLSGAMDAVDTAAERAEQIGARGRKLAVGGAFHSPLMAPAAEALAEALDGTDLAEPAFPVLSNGSARPFTDIRAELAQNLLKPVRFRETLVVLQDMGAEEFIEVGPGNVLKGLVKRTLRAAA